MSWVEHVEDWHVKAIGGIEVAGAAGVMLPALTGIAQSIIPLAAAGLTATMVGAAITNIRSGEPGLVPINAVLIGLAVSVARRARGDAVAG